MILLDGNLVSWKSKKQSTVALTSTEAEAIAATETASELLWTVNIMYSFGLDVGVPKLLCES